MIMSLAISLFLTLVIEISISLIIGIRKKEDLKIVFWANVLTNPVVVYVTNCVKIFSNNEILYNIIVLIMELLAVIVEFIVFKKYLEYKEKSPLIISIINNVVSFSLGIIISKLIF